MSPFRNYPGFRNAPASDDTIEPDLKDREEFFRTIADFTFDWEYWVAPDGSFIYISPSCRRITGYAPEEFIADPSLMRRLVHPDDKETFNSHLHCSIVGSETDGVDFRIIRADGEIRWIAHVCTRVFDSKGNFKGVRASNRDITDRRATLDELSRSEERYRRITKSVTDYIYTVRLSDGKPVETVHGDACIAVTGFSSDEFFSNPYLWISMVHPDDREMVERHASETISAGLTVPLEHRIIRKDGETRWISNTSVPQYDQYGKMVSYDGLIRDITDRKMAEAALNEKKTELEELNSTLEVRVREEVAKNRDREQLMLAQGRLAAMGEMISAISHQWRQPLNNIGLIIQNLRSSYEFGELTQEEIAKDSDTCMEIIRFMSQTIDDFRNFFRTNKEPVRFLLSDTARRAMTFVEASLKNSNIATVVDGDDSIYVTGFPNEYAQVVLNILTNAKDALAGRTGNDGMIRIRVFRDGDCGVISIQDNAGGIPEENLEKIFDPYFTTKGKGTGIGLYLSKIIIERNMGGTISVANRDGGALFKIAIPVSRS